MDSQGFLRGPHRAAGTFTFTVTATDSYSPPDIASDTPMTAVVSISAPFLYRFAFIFPKHPVEQTLQWDHHRLRWHSALYLLCFRISPSRLGTPLIHLPGKSAERRQPLASITSSTCRHPTRVLLRKQAFQSIQLGVAAPLGRNDSPASATKLGNGLHFRLRSVRSRMHQTYTAPDTDYYRIIAAAGSTVHVETFAKRYYPSNVPLDTVLEITDQNGVRLTTGCNQPGGTTTDFSSPLLE